MEYTDNNKIKLINWKYTGELNTSALNRKEGGGDLKDICTDPFPVPILVTVKLFESFFSLIRKCCGNFCNYFVIKLLLTICASTFQKNNQFTVFWLLYEYYNTHFNVLKEMNAKKSSLIMSNIKELSFCNFLTPLYLQVATLCRRRLIF